MTTPIISICIPTNGRLEILERTLNSIYESLNVNQIDFEVVISDNAKNDDIQSLLKKYNHFLNLNYYKTNCEGFLNSINALEKGKGHLLKLHNNYSIVEPFFISQLIELVKKEIDNKPLLFFSNGELKENKLLEYNTFDNFSKKISYYNSWSTAFSIWKTDLEIYQDFSYDEMFPHTSLLMEFYHKKKYVINDIKSFVNQEVSKKGGYNLFKVFGVNYLNIIEESYLKKSISKETYTTIKKDLFYKFFVQWYYMTKLTKNEFTFELNNIKKSMSVFYSKEHYYYMIVLSYIQAFKVWIKNVVKK